MFFTVPDIANTLYSILYFLLILFGIFGCGGDEGTTSEDLVGTWELITVDGKMPRADVQQIAGNEDFEVLAVALKVVFASDRTLFQELSITARRLINTSPSLIYLRMYMSLTTKGRYVASDSTVQFIQALDPTNIQMDFSWETPGNSDLKQRLDQNSDWEQYEQELESAFRQGAQDFGFEVDTYTYKVEGDILTLTNGIEDVYRKR